MLRILVADDHDIFRRGLKNLLGSQPGWEVIGEAKTGEEAVARTTERKPDIVVIDINMPGLNGLEAAREIHKLFPKIGILILTVHFSDQLLTDVIEAGARGYVMKSDADRDLVRAVSALAATARGTFFTRCATEVLLNEYPSGKFGPGLQPPLRERLTTREREIVRLLAVGKNNREVGSLLGISIKTVQTHRANLMRKLEIHSTAEVVRYAVKNEIIEA